MKPTEPGHSDGTRPEELFATGYAASFHDALMLLAARRGIALKGAEVTVAVHLGNDPTDGMPVLSARVRVHLPGIPRSAAAELVRTAERICPYTKMARHGIESIITLTGHDD